MSIVSPIKSYKKVFRRSSNDSGSNIPRLVVPQSPRQRSLSITRPELPRPLTSRTILKSIPNYQNLNTVSILPANPETTLKFLGEFLSEFEHIEILDYSEIYYIGKTTKIRGKINDNNWGYDSVKGDYILLIGDHIEYRYEIVAVLGKGTFGQVCRCFDHLTKEFVAIKIVKNKPKLNRQSMIEIKILKTLNKIDSNNSENIIRMKNFFTFRSHVCMVFELLSINLYEYSKINMFKQISFPTLSIFAKQIFKSVKFIHDQNIIHCDLKPENILLAASGSNSIKIIDFGSSCFANEKIYSYIQSRYYRAPEIILGIPYTQSIDIWSAACILVELYIGFPLFPGESESDLLGKIIEVLGLPPSHVLAQCKRKKQIFDTEDKKYKEKYRSPGSRSLSEIIGTNDLLFLDFIKECLVWDFKTRLNADAALSHPWMQKNYIKTKRGYKESFLKTEVILKKLYNN